MAVEPAQLGVERVAPYRDRSRRPDALARLCGIRQRQERRRQRQHGQVPGGQSLLGSRQCLPADPRWFGFACEYDVERKFRETRLYQVAPISTNLILSYVAEHLLELPRSF